MPVENVPPNRQSGRILVLGGVNFALFSNQQVRGIMLRFILLMGAVPLILPVTWGQTPNTGAISGVVANAKGVGIAASVQVSLLGSHGPITNVKTSATGSFSISSLAPGWYQLYAAQLAEQIQGRPRGPVQIHDLIQIAIECLASGLSLNGVFSKPKNASTMAAPPRPFSSRADRRSGSGSAALAGWVAGNWPFTTASTNRAVPSGLPWK